MSLMGCALLYILILATPAQSSFPGMYPIVGSGGAAQAALSGFSRVFPLLMLGLTSIILSEGPRPRHS